MIVRAYHGTTVSMASRIRQEGFLDRRIRPRPRWLGPGLYFYQEAKLHAIKWAQYLAAKRGEGIAIVTADIDLSDAIDLLDSTHWDDVRRIIAGITPPAKNQLGPEALFRYLSKTEKESLYHNHEDDHYFTHIRQAYIADGQKVTAIRAAFIEGSPIHPRSWLFDLSHVQICVKKPEIVKIVDAAKKSQSMPING